MTLRVLTRATLRSFPRSSLPKTTPHHAVARLNSTTTTNQPPLPNGDLETSESVQSQTPPPSHHEGTSTRQSSDARLEALMQEARAFLHVAREPVKSAVSHSTPLEAIGAEASAENICEEICEFELGEAESKIVEGANVETAQTSTEITPKESSEPAKGELESEAETETVAKIKPLRPLALPAVTSTSYRWISFKEFTDFVGPLYERGWEIGFLRYHSLSAMGLILSNRAFTFKSWNQAMEFVNVISELAEKEKHHPDSLTVSWKNQVVQVEMSLRTHSAKRTEEITSSSTPAKIPSVTSRDLRLAAHAEMIYEYKYNGEPGTLPPAFRQPPWPTIHKLLNVLPNKFTKYCTLCGRHGHAGEDCTSDAAGQKKYLPVCRKCQRRHAPMGLCPRPMKKLEKPTTPCPNCGGDHWLADCRKPQVPSSEAQAMMLPIPGNTANLRGDIKLL